MSERSEGTPGQLTPALNAEAARPTLAPGERVGEFVVEGVLDRGGFGVVYQVADPRGQSFALKVSRIRGEDLPTAILVAQQNEIDMMGRLQHPGLVKLHRAGLLEDGSPYLLMELIKGELLSDYIRRNQRLDTLEALSILRAVTDVVATCHEHGILHLDLKPTNVIITDSTTPKVKVLDFGTSTLREVRGFSNNQRLVGTLTYMAPEAFLGVSHAQQYSERSDLYALGCMLYEMIAGMTAFHGSKVPEVHRQKTTLSLPRLSAMDAAVPEAVDLVVEDLLRPSPEQRRPQTARALSDLLAHLYFRTLRGEALTESRPTLVTDEVQQIAQLPCIGREAELASMRRKMESSFLHRRSSGVILVAESGLGKSRIAAEFASKAASSGQALVLYARCRQQGDLVSYGPLREILDDLRMSLRRPQGDLFGGLRASLLRHAYPEWDALIELVPELGGVLPLPPAPDPSARRLQGVNRVISALSRLLGLVTELIPVVLLVEDLQWVDAGTVGVLSGLCDQAMPLFLLGTSRSTPAQLPPGLSLLALPPLSSSSQRELLGSLLSSDPARGREMADTLLASVPLLAQGVPLATQQLVLSLRHEGYLTPDPQGLRLSKPIDASYRPPDTVSTLLLRSLEDLPAPLIRTLSLAACIDRSFLLDDLISLDLVDAATARAALQTARELQLVWLSGGVFTFSHDSTRETFRGFLPPDQLADVHRRIAAALAARGKPKATVAIHLEAAGEPLRAAALFYEAVQESTAVNDPLGSVRIARKAMNLLLALPQSPERDKLLQGAAHELARVGTMLGRITEVSEALQRVTEATTHLDDSARLALNSAWARLYYVQGDMPKAVEHSRRCLTVTGQDAAGLLYQSAPLNIVGRALCATGKFGPAVGPLTKGCSLARQLKEWVELCHSEGLLAVSLAFTGRIADAQAASESASELGFVINDPFRILGGWFYKAAVAESSGDYEAGREASAQLLAYAESQRVGGLYLCVGTTFTGRHQFHLGQLSRARLLLRNAIHIARLQGIMMGVGWSWAFLGDTCLAQGELEEAQAAYRSGLELGNAGAKDEYAAGLSLSGLAHVTALIRGPEGLPQVREHLNEAITRLEAVNNLTTLSQTLQRGHEALRICEAPDAEDLHERLRDLHKKIDAPVLPWWPRPLAGPSAAPSPQPGSSSSAHSGPRAPARRPTPQPLESTLDDGSLSPGTAARGFEDALSTMDQYFPAFLEQQNA